MKITKASSREIAISRIVETLNYTRNSPNTEDYGDEMYQVIRQREESAIIRVALSLGISVEELVKKQKELEIK